MFKNDTIFWHWIYWDGSVLRMRHWRHESFVDMGSACQCLTLLGRVNMGCAHCMPLHSPRERRQELPHRSLAASAKTGARLSSDAAVALWSCPRSPQSGRQGSARGLSPQIHPDHQVGVGKPRVKASFKGELTRISMSHRTVRKVSHELSACYWIYHVYLTTKKMESRPRPPSQWPLQQSPPIGSRSLCWWNAPHAALALDLICSKSPGQEQQRREQQNSTATEERDSLRRASGYKCRIVSWWDGLTLLERSS